MSFIQNLSIKLVNSVQSLDVEVEAFYRLRTMLEYLASPNSNPDR